MAIFKPQEGIQDQIVRSNVDVLFAGAGASTGKTFGILLSVAPYINIPEFRALFLRRTLGEVGAVGGMVDELKRIYDFKRIAESKIPEMEFDSGAKIMLSHLANEEPEYLRERLRGYQAEYIFLDEGTSYRFSTFTYLLSRNRGSSGISGKFRVAYNPKRTHWTRKFVDWYIGEDGYPIPERIGVVRYFFIKNESDVEQVVWGSTKKEVYEKAKSRIDKLLDKAKGNVTYDTFIKSFVFYTDDIYANKEFLAKNPTYIASLASLGDTVAAQLLLNNHNVDEDDYNLAAVSVEEIAGMFNADANDNGDYALTADIALGGKDNFLALVWKGLHCVDMLFMEKCNANQALGAIRRLQNTYLIPDSRVVFDGISIGEFIGGTYGMIAGAYSFKAGSSPVGLGRHNYSNLKAQCADKLVTLIKQGLLTISPTVANSIYRNQHFKGDMITKDVISDEFKALRLEQQTNGKLKLISKDAQKEILSGRSPDILDNMIYLCYFYLDYIDSNLEEADTNVRSSRWKAESSTDDNLMDFLEVGGFY